MTGLLGATPHSQPLASQLPASQTAPVAEFRCLYTPDVRKKQKKWHDGFLKFHSFNSRVMVYDQARNFLGDTYYKDADELHEGDELTLDRGVMVEVADALGVTQTDLKPLFEKKPKEAPPPPTAPPRRFQPPSQVARPQPAPSTNTARPSAQQLRHKSLNTLLGTPKGPIGKSVPIKSPYEARREKEREKEKENDFAVDRAAKRQKTAHGSTSSAILRLSSPAPADSPAANEKELPRTRPSITKTVRKPATPIPPDTPIITLDELDAIAQVSSPPSLPTTPPAVFAAASRPVVTPAQPVQPPIAANSVKQTPRLPRGKVPVPSVKALETPRAPAPPSSPPVSASNRLTNVDFAIQPTTATANARRPPEQLQPSLPPPSPPRNPRAKSLRLSKGVKRGTLMICQPPPPLPRSRESSEARCIRNSTAPRRDSPAPATVSVPRSTSSRSKASTSKRRAGSQNRYAAPRAKLPANNLLDDFDDDPDLVHSFMDQQLLVSGTPPPEPILVPAGPEVVPRQKPLVTAVQKTRMPEPNTANASILATVAWPPVQISTGSNFTKMPAEKPSPAIKPSPPVANISEAAEKQSRAASPVLGATSEHRSRTESLSPRKHTALSTGGFRKRAKRATLQPALPTPEMAPAAARNESVILPPHPLRANKEGPVMTTTELAAMLQHPKRKAKAAADPIEDRGDVAGTSPNRKFRRVRSENDAPIPSTSEDWEKRNLPKATTAAVDVAPVVSTIAPEPAAAVAKKKSGLAALIKKTDPRKKLVRTQSLTVEITLQPAQDVESPMASPVVDKDVGPWSTEAFDLFDWRPPGREQLGS